MALATVASSSVTAMAISVSTVVITKPSGTVDGDLLILVLGRSDGSGGTYSGDFTGWTLIKSTTQTTGGLTTQLLTYYKVASSEPANYTFTSSNSGTTVILGGGIARVTGGYLNLPSVSGDAVVANSATPSFANTITPAEGNSLLLLAVVAADSNANGIGGYAIATSNPSWTEDFDTGVDNTNNGASLSLAHATRPEITATGNSSVTGLLSTSDSIAHLIAIYSRETVSVSDTIVTSENNSYIRGLLTTVMDTVALVEDVLGSIRSSRIWSNLRKSGSLLDGLVAYYELDEASGNAIDSVDGNNGTVSGAIQNVAGEIGPYYDFDGVDDYIQLPDTTVTRASFSLASQDTSPRGIAFNSDGRKMYMVGDTSTEKVYEYDLSTAWDVSTAVFLQSFNISGQETTPQGIAFNNTGSIMYILGNAGNDVTYYTLSTPYNVSTAVHVSQFSISGQTTDPRGFTFKSDGTKMYVVSATEPDTIYQYTLATPWDMSTASYDSISLNIDAVIDTPTGIAFSSPGTEMYVSNANTDVISLFNLSVAWDISSATIDTTYNSSGRVFLLSQEDGTPQSLVFSSDGTRFYIIGDDNNTVYQYTLPSAYGFRNDQWDDGLSIAVWIKADSVGEGSGGRIYDVSRGTSAEGGFRFNVAPNVELSANVNAGTVRSSGANSLGAFGDGLLYLVSVTFTPNGSTSLVNFYINGVQVGTANQSTGGLTAGLIRGLKPRIGNRATATDRSFDGGILKVGVWEKVLSASEESSLYKGGLGLSYPLSTLRNVIKH